MAEVLPAIESLSIIEPPVSEDVEPFVLSAAKAVQQRRKGEKRISPPPFLPDSERAALSFLEELFAQKSEWFLDITPKDEEEEGEALPDSPTMGKPPMSRIATSVASPPPVYQAALSSPLEVQGSLPPSYRPSSSSSTSSSPFLSGASSWGAPPGLGGGDQSLGLTPVAMQSSWSADSNETGASCPLPYFPVRMGKAKAKAKMQQVTMPQFAAWNESPALVFVVRRSGCPMCRAQALLISHSRLFLKRLGFKTVVIFNTQNSDNGAFAESYWGGESMLDESLSFHTALGGGEARMANPMKEAFTPAFMKRVVKAMVQHRAMPGMSNKTAGAILGGMMLVIPGSGLVYVQNEDSLGDFGSFGEVLRKAYEHSAYKDKISEDELQSAIDAHEMRVKSSGLLKMSKPKPYRPLALRK